MLFLVHHMYWLTLGSNFADYMLHQDKAAHFKIINCSGNRTKKQNKNTNTHTKKNGSNNEKYADYQFE